jgi:hypothetical protein
MMRSQATRSRRPCCWGREVGALIKWEIDELLATTSDHEVIVFEWMPLNAVFLEGKMDAARKWNIDRVCADQRALKAASEDWFKLSEGRPLINAWATSPTELEAEARWIQENLRAVLGLKPAAAPAQPCILSMSIDQR